MGTRSDYKRFDDLSAWDLDSGCRSIIDQSTPGRRRLKKVLRRQARKRINNLNNINIEEDLNMERSLYIELSISFPMKENETKTEAENRFLDALDAADLEYVACWKDKDSIVRVFDDDYENFIVESED